MGIEEFPEIESFQRLPKKLIVKGGDSTVDSNQDTTFKGLVINNLGQSVKDVVVHLIVFDEDNIPVLQVSAKPEPDRLSQGNMASFKVKMQGFAKPINNYYLHSQWKYDDSEWSV